MRLEAFDLRLDLGKVSEAVLKCLLIPKARIMRPPERQYFLPASSRTVAGLAASARAVLSTGCHGRTCREKSVATFSIPRSARRRRDLASPDQALDCGGKQKKGSRRSSIDGSSVIVIAAASKCSIVRPRCLLKMIPMNPMRKVPTVTQVSVISPTIWSIVSCQFSPSPTMAIRLSLSDVLNRLCPEYLFERYSTDVNSWGAFA